MSLVAAGFPSVANAANKPGDRCAKAGITLHVGNIDIWGALNSANRIWHNVPVFIKTGQGLQYIAQKSLYIESVTLNRVTFTTL